MGEVREVDRGQAAHDKLYSLIDAFSRVGDEDKATASATGSSERDPASHVNRPQNFVCLFAERIDAEFVDGKKCRQKDNEGTLFIMRTIQPSSSSTTKSACSQEVSSCGI